MGDADEVDGDDAAPSGAIVSTCGLGGIVNDALPPVVPAESREFCTAYDRWMEYRRKGVVDAYLLELEATVMAAYHRLPPVKIDPGGKPPGAVKMHPWDLP